MTTAEQGRQIHWLWTCGGVAYVGYIGHLIPRPIMVVKILLDWLLLLLFNGEQILLLLLLFNGEHILSLITLDQNIHCQRKKFGCSSIFFFVFPNSLPVMRVVNTK